MKIAANTATTTYILPELRSSVAISTSELPCAKIEAAVKHKKQITKRNFFIVIVLGIMYQVSNIEAGV